MFDIPGRQTVDRFQSFINEKLSSESFLRDFQTEESSQMVEDHVLRNVAGQKEDKKFDLLKKRIVEEVETLFYIVHDEGELQVVS